MAQHCDKFYKTGLKVWYEWKIAKFIDKALNNSESLDSPKFLLSGSQFFFRMYPYGECRYSEYVSLFLHKEPSLTQHHVEFTLGLRREDGSVLVTHNFIHLFTPENQRCGYSKMIKRSMLTSREAGVIKFSGDQTLTVFCKVRLTDVSVVEDSSVEAETQIALAESIHTLLKDFERFYLSGCQSDIELDVRGVKFPAHKFVLSSRSSVFGSMFEADMTESKTGYVKITDCDPEAFGAFLIFLYSGKMDVVTSDNAMGLYAVSHKYNVQDLKKECCDCLARELSFHSIFDVILFAAFNEERELLKSATTYFLKNSSNLLTTLEWQTLLRNNPNQANKLLLIVADRKTD